ncbi:hypothetical protein ACHAWF_007530 [Thalassiosira exigua]
MATASLDDERRTSAGEDDRNEAARCNLRSLSSFDATPAKTWHVHPTRGGTALDRPGNYPG